MKVLTTQKLDLPMALNLMSLMGCSVQTIPRHTDLEKAVVEGKPDVILLGPDYQGDPDDFRRAGLVVFLTSDLEAQAWQQEAPISSNGDNANPADTADMIFRLAHHAAQAAPNYLARMDFMGASHILEGLVLGLIGFGGVGKEMRDRAEMLNMPVVVYSTHLPDENADYERVRRMPDVATLAAQSDIVAVHESLRADTFGLLDDLFFAALKPSALLINTSSSLLFAGDGYLDYLARDSHWTASRDDAQFQATASRHFLQEVQKYRSERIGL